MSRPLFVTTLLLVLPLAAVSRIGAEEAKEAAKPEATTSQFGSGSGPSVKEGTYHVLDDKDTPNQSNAIAFDRRHEGARARVGLTCELKVMEGGDGGAIAFLNTAEYGASGPAPFVKDWTAPNLRKSFAVGIDVHNPPPPPRQQNQRAFLFGPRGNYQDKPQREISLHFDGRELVKRVAPVEFRGDFAPVEIAIDHVAGGAAVTVKIAGGTVYDRHFVAHMHPYEMRLAFGASTRAKVATRFAVRKVELGSGQRAERVRPPLQVEVFHHVMTHGKQTAYEAEVDLPPLAWAFERVIMTIDIHDGGKMWDEWDRNGEVSIFDAEGVKRGIVPFITSYRTPCHWKVDVTHFRPYLSGKTKFEIAAGTTFYKNRGYLMSVSLDFHHGTSKTVPTSVHPIWVGTAKYKSGENHFQDFFAPQTVAIPESTEAARLFVTTTGHSQIGEFTPSDRTIIFAPEKGGAAGAEQRFDNRLWKDDVYLNPNRPQGGTWKFARAGWAPGDVVHPWWIDLTPHLRKGADAELRYEAKPYEFPEGRAPNEKQIGAASHVVRAYLILYESGEGVVPAPVLRVTDVTKDSNAAKAGMKRGDYFASYDGAQVDSIDDLRAAMSNASSSGKEKVIVVVYRGLDAVELELDVGQMGVSLGQ